MPKRHKNKIIISSLVILGIMFIILGSVNAKTDSNNSENYVNNLENKLENFLKTVEGINEAKVIITLEENDEEEIKEIFGDESTSTLYPKVRGVAVACTNGNDYKVQEKITNIVSSYLGISSNRVKIVAIK